MDFEGEGRRSPKPLPIEMTAGTMVAAYQDAKAIAAKRLEWRGGRSKWKRGLIAEKVMPNVGRVPQHIIPIYIGIGGEMAFSQMMNRRIHGKPDITLRRLQHVTVTV